MLVNGPAAGVLLTTSTRSPSRVPDESARTVLFDYINQINPRRAEWPKAEIASRLSGQRLRKKR